MFCTMMPGPPASTNFQLLRVIRLFLGRTNLCESALLKHKAMLTGESTSRGLLRWSRLGERCTPAQCPRPPGAALHPFPRPASVIQCLVCLWWRSCDKGGRCVVLQELRRVCLHRIIGAGWSAHRPFPQGAPHSTQRTPRIACDSHQYQQWCAGEGVGQRRWWMGAWSRGGSVRERVHARTPIFSVPQVQHRSHSTKQPLLLLLVLVLLVVPLPLGPSMSMRIGYIVARGCNGHGQPHASRSTTCVLERIG